MHLQGADKFRLVTCYDDPLMMYRLAEVYTKTHGCVRSDMGFSHGSDLLCLSVPTILSS